jgi:hypothetical protein
MGNDGGNLLTRIDLIKEKKIKQNIRRNYEKEITCDMSREKLNPPVVICKLGFIFNKEILIKRLLEKSIPVEFRYLKKLKDVKQVNDESILKDKITNEYKLVCALTKEEYIGNKNFVFFFKCGCLISCKYNKLIEDKSSKEVSCPNCSTINNPSDIIKLGLSIEEIDIKKQELLADYKIEKHSRTKELNTSILGNKRKLSS